MLEGKESSSRTRAAIGRVTRVDKVPSNATGVPGTVLMIDDGTSAPRLYIRGVDSWWYVEMTKA